MKKSSHCCRCEKNPKHTAFRRAEPFGRIRLIKEEMGGEHRYKQAVPSKSGGRYAKLKKF